ncbi:hypothetical protein ABT040_35020 [Streptomyces sp. NPDC002688]|uniref:hypothetical protein n=1 Tax=Streptomyces sp. NPDC002688 TaxID=3154423 RepID=UPI0033179E03
MSDSVPEGEVPQPVPAADPGVPAEALPGPAYDPAAPAPLNVPWVSTGNADVDARLDRLADADHLATDGHVEVYEDVHRGLRDELTALDVRQGPPAPALARPPLGGAPNPTAGPQ